MHFLKSNCPAAKDYGAYTDGVEKMEDSQRDECRNRISILWLWCLSLYRNIACVWQVNL